jgi:hypothetical protein
MALGEVRGYWVSETGIQTINRRAFVRVISHQYKPVKKNTVETNSTMLVVQALDEPTALRRPGCAFETHWQSTLKKKPAL